MKHPPTWSMATADLTADLSATRPVPRPTQLDIAGAPPLRPPHQRIAEIRRFVRWLRRLDLEQAATIHQTYNAAPASVLILATDRAQIAAAQTDLSHALVSDWITKADRAISHAARCDTSSTWHGHWPVVSWAAEAAIWGLAADIPRHSDTLTAAVRAAGFTGGR
jgi:hypothetical protein